MKLFVKKYSYILIYIISAIILGTILMILVYMLPVGRIRKNIQESIVVYKNERASHDKPTITPGLEIGKFDDFTDSIILRECMYKDENSIIYNAMMNNRWVFDDIDGQVESLIASADDDLLKNAKAQNYARYWNGYLLYMKPLLVIFNVSEIRVLNMMLQVLLLCIAIIGIYKKLGAKIAIAFGGIVAFLNPVALSASFQFYDIYYILLIETVVIMFYDDYLDKNDRWDKLLLITGILIAFFDFLTYPIVSFGIIIIFYMLLHQKQSVKDSIIQSIRFIILWGVGYVGMWIGKWVVAAILTGKNVVKDGIDRVALHTVSNTQKIQAFDGLIRNIKAVLIKPFIIPVIILILVFIVMIISKKISFKPNLKFLLKTFIVIIIPFIWLIIMNRHAYNHCWMEYREFSVTLFGLLCFVCSSITMSSVICKKPKS